MKAECYDGNFKLMKFKFENKFKNNENKSGKSIFHKFTFIWGQEQCKFSWCQFSLICHLIALGKV